MRIKGTIAVVCGALMLTACGDDPAPYQETITTGTIERIEKYEEENVFGTIEGTLFALQGSETIYNCRKAQFLLCMLLKEGDQVEIGYGVYRNTRNFVSSLSIVGSTPAE